MKVVAIRWARRRWRVSLLLAFTVGLVAGCRSEPEAPALVSWIENQVEIDGTVIAAGATLSAGNRLDVFPKNATFKPQTGAARVRFRDGAELFLRATDREFTRLQIDAGGTEGPSVTLLEGRLGFQVTQSALTLKVLGRTFPLRDAAGIVMATARNPYVAVSRGRITARPTEKLEEFSISEGSRCPILNDGYIGPAAGFDTASPAAVSLLDFSK